MKYHQQPPLDSWGKYEKNPWWCPICDRGHVIPALVQDCIRKAGGLDPAPSQGHK